ncbi:Spy0128 family protein [Breznakia pachnodae]|uniref:Pilin isopeptide linkage protein n=1 Tax=Breznakia pachnodae TaxID=265178 RepID=A0ABU0DYH4_9FIRM|nr:FctA domain-containing protein [Breznakia pachnodae]MDQ0359554.1 pilin isopeptide linkage protein [Breznakia pachnodae]
MKKISKIIFATIMLVSTFIGSNTGINIHAKEIEWINQIEITKEDGSVPEKFQQDENVKVNFNWNFDNKNDFEGEKTLYFPTELNILTSEEISLTNINGSEVGKVVIDKDNHSLSFKLDDNAESYTNLNGTLSIDVKLDAKESAELYFYDHNNAEFTKYLQMEEVVNDSTNNIQPLYVGGTPNQNVSGKFEIDKLTLSVASYHGGPKTSIYEEVGGVSSGVQPALDLQTYGSPTFYFDMSWSLINSADIGFEKGDFINFDICTIKGPDSVVSGMSFGEKILYGDDGKKLAVGTVEKQKIKDGEYKLVYVITFDPDITIDLPSLTDIKGTMDGFATMSGTKAGESIIINRGEDTVAEIERVDPPVGNKPGIGTEIKPSGKSFSIYNDDNKLIDWKVLINDYASTQFSISKPYTYKDLIFEEYVDYHQTFNAYPEASWRVNGVAVQFGVPIYLHNNTTNRTFQSNLTTMSGESYINIGSGNAAQNRGFTFIDPGTTSASMAAAEASVRSTGKTWTIILEDDGSGNERERLIANFGSPSSGNYVKYGDVYDLEKIQDEIDAIKLNADYMIQQGIDNNADEGDELIDSNNLKLKLSEWRELSQACIDSKVYYQTNPPVFTYNGYVTTRVKVDQNETGTVEKVTNGFRVSGGWSTEEYSAEALNGWSGTISGKPTNGDAVIYKADSTYGNSENKDDDTAINGYLENVSFEVYKVGGTTPLKFDYTDGKYVFSNTGATETLTTGSGTGRFVINKLAPGNYYLKEVVSPSGFYSGQNERIEFSVADDKITYKLINNEPRGVELKKVDETTLDALSGAVFELYKYDTDINNATKVTGFTKTLISGEDWYVHDDTGSDSLTVGSILLSKGKLKVLRLDAGNYYFKEVTPPNGYVLSDTKYTFTLGDGLPASSPTIVDVGNITNKLYTADGDITFNATKTMSGRDFKLGDEFTFELYQVNGSTETLIESKKITPTSGTSASIAFKKLDYTLIDKNQTYTYRIKEKQENTISGVTYSTKVYEGEYKVTDNGNGTLSVTKQSGHDLTSGTVVNFVNTYAATGDITFNATKTMSGRDFKFGDTFTFELYQFDGVNETLIDSKTIAPSSGTSASIVFKKLDYTLTDKNQTYTYRIKEKQENTISGVTYSTKVYEGVYKVTDNGDGTLLVTKESGHDLTSGTIVNFINTYSATGDITFNATKTMNGRNFQSGDTFTFELYKVVGSTVTKIDSKTITPTSGTTAPIVFDKINYTLADKDQTYTYKIVEKKENINGITYSTAEYKADYKITDTGNGTLSITRDSGHDLTSATVVDFTNIYGSDGNIAFNASKTMSGRDFKKNDTFTFELYRVDSGSDVLIDSKTITPTSGTKDIITFNTLNYGLSDKDQTYTYKIVEKVGNITGITYSTKVYTGTYKISDNGDGTLDVTNVAGDDLTSASIVEFVNVYEETKVTGDVELIKLDAQTKTALSGATFSLHRSDDTLIKEGLVSDENGKVIYTGLEVGTYYFKETKAPTGYVLNSQKITFEIRDNQKSVITLSFENDKIPDKPSIDTPTRDKNVTFRPSKAPRTGDTTNSNYFMFLLLLSGVFVTYGFKKNMYKNNK